MAQTSLFSQMQFDITVLPSTFITDYMPFADGSCVKVYLYLLHTLPTGSFSLKKMEETLRLDRKQSCYALHYWENHGLLSLSMDTSGDKLLSMTLLPVKPSSFMTMFSEDEEEGPVTKTVSQASVRSEVKAVVLEDGKKETSVKETISKTSPALSSAAKALVPSLDSSELLSVTQSSSFQVLLFTLQQPQMMNDIFSSKEADQIARLYLKLQKDEDIVIYVCEYCIDHYTSSFSGKKKNCLRKAEELADAIVAHFKDQGAFDLNKVRHFINAIYSKRYLTEETYTDDDKEFSHVVLDYICPDVKSATPAELNTIHYWRSQFDVNSDQMILYACNIVRKQSLNDIQSGSKLDYFGYLVGILKNWKEAGIRTVEDAEASDKKHREKAVSSNAKQTSGDRTSYAKKTSAKDYNDFPQHDYNYDQMSHDLFEQVFEEVKHHESSN